MEDYRNIWSNKYCLLPTNWQMSHKKSLLGFITAALLFVPVSALAKTGTYNGSVPAGWVIDNAVPS